MDNLRVSADSKPDSLLRLVGVDTPSYQAPQVNAPNTTQVNSGANTVANSAPSIKPMQQALQSTQQSLTGALEGYNQGLNQQAQRKLEVVQAEQQAALKRSMVQAAAAAQNGEVISSLAQTAAQYLMQRQQANVALQAQAAEALKQQRKANYTAATVAAHELKSEAENGGYKEKGTTYYTQKFQEQVYTADMDDEDRLALVQDFYKHRDSYEQQAREARDKSIKELRVAAREREKQQNILDLQPVFSAVKDNPYADPEVAMGKLREKIADVYQNPDYTPTEKDDMTAAMLREAIPYVSSNVQAQVKLAVLQQDVADYKGYEADQVLQYQNGQLNRQKMLSNLETFKHIKGLGDVPAYDPKADLEFQQFTQESTQKNADYTLKRSREAADNVVQLDDQAASAYAIQLATSMGGSGIAELEARGMESLTRGEQVVLLRAKKLVELREQEATLRKSLANAQASTAQVNLETLQKYMRLTQKNREATSLESQIAQDLTEKSKNTLDGKLEEERKQWAERLSGKPKEPAEQKPKSIDPRQVVDIKQLADNAKKESDWLVEQVKSGYNALRENVRTWSPAPTLGGKQSPEQQVLEKLPENLRLKLFTSKAEKLTPEELKAVEDAIVMQREASGAKLQEAQGQLQQVQAQLAQFGLSSDMAATHKYMSDGLSKWQQYQKNWTETARGYAVRQATPQNNQELGVMSPF